MKLAYFSPLNPQPSGISDYSEELLPYLARHCEVDLFVDGFRPSNSAVSEAFTCFDYQKHPATLDALKNYDAIVYHLGNDHRYHAGIMEVAHRYPGIIVFHDFVLQDFFLGLAQERHDPSISRSTAGLRAPLKELWCIQNGPVLVSLNSRRPYTSTCPSKRDRKLRDP